MNPLNPRLAAELARSRFAVLAGAIAYCVVCFAPYHGSMPFHLHDNAAVREAGELRFAAPGIAYVADAAEWLDNVRRSGTFEVRMRVTSARDDQSGPARILTVSRDPGHRNLTIGQIGDSLDVRLRQRGSDDNGTPSLSIPGVFATRKTIDIAVIAKPRRLTVVVDDEVVVSQALPRRPFRRWDPSYRIALGNELTFDRPWLGTVEQASVSAEGGELSLLDPNVSSIPSVYVQRSDKLIDTLQNAMAPLFIWNTINVFDRIVNVLGYLPFGALMAWRQRGRRPLLAAMSASFLLSLFIETGQLFVDHRHPSVSDLAMNTLGGLIAALLVLRASGRHARRSLSASDAGA